MCVKPAAILVSPDKEDPFAIRMAENGKEAVEILKEWSPHLVFMDIRMPVMDGYVATRTIRELPEGNEVSIVAVTAHAFDEYREEILTAGRDDLVRKPYREQQIFDVISQHLGAEYIYSDEKETPEPQESIALTAEMLIELPGELLSGLREATLTLNRNAISTVIEQIEPQAPDTARALLELINNFQMSQVNDLLESL